MAAKSKVFQIRNQAAGKLLRVLSIDGGGVKGIVPTVILDFLESQLQKLDGEDARIIDYFDVVAGANTGGFTAALLTSPNQNNRPLFAAKELTEFYLENFPKIYPQSNNILDRAKTTYNWLVNGQKYDGQYLRSIVKQNLGHTKLHQTLTNIVIPTYCLKRLNPQIFSTYEKHTTASGAYLSDICIGTLITPTYFPPHSFLVKHPNGLSTSEFELVNEGFTATNPTEVALDQILKELRKHRIPEKINRTLFGPKKNPPPPHELGRFLVLSIGTGSPKFDANKAEKWLNFREKLIRFDSESVANVISRIAILMSDYESDFYSGDFRMVENDVHTILQTYQSEENFLKIQDDTLTGVMCSLDVATKENLENLVEVGKELLNKSVSSLDLETGIYLPSGLESNEEALVRLAAILSREKRLRDSATG